MLAAPPLEVDSKRHLRQHRSPARAVPALETRRLRVVHQERRTTLVVGDRLEGEHRARDTQPERALLAREDQFIAGEFLADLTHEELPVFRLGALEGLSWRAIATTLGIDPNEARSSAR